MPNIEKHAPGEFCWIELGTTDQAAAKKFYGSLFGWAIFDAPMGPGEFYTMFSLEGRNTGAAYTMKKEDLARGVPPHWMLYITVETADAAAKKAAELGGKVLAPAFDVMDVGRMAVLQDPTGAIFSVWQATQHTGTGIAGVDGTLCWADLSTTDPERASKFYSGLFGWTMTPGEGKTDTSGYLHIKNGENFIGGIPPTSARDSKGPAHWLAYLKTSKCDATAAKATQLGAKLVMAPTTFENVGRIAVIADPQGAVFAIFQTARSGEQRPPV